MANSCCNTDLPPVSSELDFDEVAGLCKALGHPARVRLLKHLIDYGSCYFGNLTDVLPLAPSTISQHVTILKEAGLITGTSAEQRMCYCVNPERLSQLKALISIL
jgi:ArsR family transcriptional regulator